MQANRKNALTSGAMDRLVQFRRAALADDGIAQVETFANHGSPVWAHRRDVSDGEKTRSGQSQAAIMARFTVHSGDLTRGVTPKDRLVCDAMTWEIVGIKEIGRDYRLEITATARLDA